MAVSLISLGCGDDGGRSDDGADGSGISVGDATAGTVGGSGDTSTTAGSASASASAGTLDDTGGSGGPKFDVGNDSAGETEGVDCECGSQIGYSYIWVANSNASTVSKINTVTMQEEGRYLTRADAAGNPSRTSVTIDGKSVAVANRNGGVIKIWAREEYCDPNNNGMPGVQTSTGANDVLPWDADDCVHWYANYDTYTTMRPIAWTAGPLDQATCQYAEQKVWVSGCQSGAHTDIQVHLLDGETGVSDQDVQVTGFPCQSYSGYGGAVDSQGNFWISDLGSMLARVDRQTFATQIWQAPNGFGAYGITVDNKGRPWLSANFGAGSSSAARFDPATETWDFATNAIGNAQSGIQQDAFGRMWMNYWNSPDAAGTGIFAIDVETMQVGPFYPIAGSQSPKGISIDLDGNVWSISLLSNQAFRFDPDTQQADSYDGLDWPYTYSDMTGWALQNASCGPQG